MRYLVITKSNPPFFTEWFEAENHFNKEEEMQVIDLHRYEFTKDGVKWENIPIDHL